MPSRYRRGPWTPEETALLTALAGRNMSYGAAAVVLHRSVEDVQAQRARLGLPERPDQPRVVTRRVFVTAQELVTARE